MRRHAIIVVLVLASVHAAHAQTQSVAGQCPTSGPGSAERRARDVVMVGWERKPGDGPLVFREKFAGDYEWSDARDRLYYDDFSPNPRPVRDPDAYGAIWAPIFSGLRSARHAISIEPTAVYGGNLAVSTLEFVALIEPADGATRPIRTLMTLTWRCHADGWRIIREHNSTKIVAADSIQSYFKTAAK
ncbi:MULTISPECIES: YybH family protein [Massilia]|uniref:SnoaL-like domain-containing protein n=1 Tax=Massilia aurea TaxID=373040 RepID=A0A422QI93_9BURK|nr:MULTISPECIES: hypothetical protein [Massilia]MDY0964969.1 hypothetical protein [Massilia sp. CFBP9026]RNF29684.1 hypothetical protein NM04_16645 [Massilia aurea]